MDKYIESIGKRKSARARVRLYPATKNSFEINGKTLDTYFGTIELRHIVREPLALLSDGGDKFKISALLSGGGIHSQAEALRLGISRALLLVEENLRGILRKNKLLTRDGRIKERRKFGLKKARKAPQWSKR